MKENKFVLPLIIILLVLSLPFSGYGLYSKIQEKIKTANPNHLPKIGDLLYFYNSKNKLVGTYKCTNKNCDEARSSNDDMYMAYNRENNENTLGVINKYYVFINDEDGIKLYNLKTKTTVNTFKSIKFYNTRNTSYIIVRSKEGKYGLLAKSNLELVLPMEYTTLAINEKSLNASFNDLRLLTSSNNKWFVINNKGERLSAEFKNPIYDYNYDAIVTISGSSYEMYDYNLIRKNVETDASKLEVRNNAIIALLKTNHITIYDKKGEKVLKRYNDENTRYSYKANDDGTITILNAITKKEIETYTIGA